MIPSALDALPLRYLQSLWISFCLFSSVFSLERTAFNSTYKRSAFLSTTSTIFPPLIFLSLPFKKFVHWTTSVHSDTSSVGTKVLCCLVPGDNLNAFKILGTYRQGIWQLFLIELCWHMTLSKPPAILRTSDYHPLFCYIENMAAQLPGGRVWRSPDPPTSLPVISMWGFSQNVKVWMVSSLSKNPFKN